MGTDKSKKNPSKRKASRSAWGPKKRPRVLFSSKDFFKDLDESDKQLDLFLKPEDIPFLLDQLKLSKETGSQIEIFLEAIRRKESNEAEILKNTALSAVFYGPSGTGKTSAAKAIARALQKKILVTTAGDLLSCWVGDTEGKIRSCFQRAQKENAVLFIDEAEGLLGSREGAQRRWELTQVNEFLRQIEEFKGILIAATNHPSLFDSAFKRRFPFKVEFDLPTGEIASEIWATFLDQACLPTHWAHGLGCEGKLSPGDIKNVATKAFLKKVSSLDELKGLIKEEVGFARASGRTIGFAPHTQY